MPALIISQLESGLSLWTMCLGRDTAHLLWMPVHISQDHLVPSLATLQKGLHLVTRPGNSSFIHSVSAQFFCTISCWANTSPTTANWFKASKSCANSVSRVTPLWLLTLFFANGNMNLRTFITNIKRTGFISYNPAYIKLCTSLVKPFKSVPQSATPNGPWRGPLIILARKFSSHQIHTVT